MGSKRFVGGLSWGTTDSTLRAAFEGFGSLREARVILDRETGRPEVGHEMLGARLGGGRLREKDTVRFS